jgi:polyisoprenoid-binding protein YceI
VQGDLTIRGVTKPVKELVHITVKEGQVSVHCKFIVKDISSYGVGKPGGKKKDNVANDIEVNYVAKYEKES